MEIANKITELSKRDRISLEEKIQIFERFKRTGEELTGDAVFEGYPVGKWAIQIRSTLKRQNEETNQRMKINPTEEQLDRLNTLGILDRQIDSTTDEKIEMLVEWMAKYPKAEIRQNIPEDILKEYATTEEEYLSIVTQYQKMQKYYEYIRARKSNGKLTEKQISKCKEGNVRGVFGYPTLVEELATKTGKSEKDIEYIIRNYGTMEHFIDLYRNGKLNDSKVEASSIIRNTIDIDLNPNSKEFDALYSDIMSIEQDDNILRLYSSEKLKEQLETLNPREKEVIERRYGLLSDDLPRDLENIAKTFGVTRNRIRQIEAKALRKLSHPSRKKQFTYNFEKNNMLTDDECKLIDSLKDKLYASDIIFRNNTHISPDDIKDKDILKAFELIRNIQEITKERKEQEEQEILAKMNTPLENTNISVKAYMYLQKRGIALIGDVKSLSPQDLIGLLEQLGKQAYVEFLRELERYGVNYIDDIENVEKMTEEEIAEKLRPEDSQEEETPIESLNLSVRAFNFIKRANLNTLGDITQLTEEELRKKFTKKICDEVIQKLGEYGLTLREDTQLEENDATHETSSNKDTFIEDVLEKATKRAEVREKEKRARELAENYEELFGKKASTDAHPFDDDGNK